MSHDQITIGTKTYSRREFGWIGPDLKAPPISARLQIAAIGLARRWPSGNKGFVLEYVLAYGFIVGALVVAWLYAPEITAWSAAMPWAK